MKCLAVGVSKHVFITKYLGDAGTHLTCNNYSHQLKVDLFLDYTAIVSLPMLTNRLEAVNNGLQECHAHRALARALEECHVHGPACHGTPGVPMPWSSLPRVPCTWTSFAWHSWSAMRTEHVPCTQSTCPGPPGVSWHVKPYAGPSQSAIT
jgi:hypothetical protein